MKALKLVSLSAFVTGILVSVPAYGQSVPSENSNVAIGQSSTGETRLPAELSQPLEVNQSQSNEFFNPPRRQQTTYFQPVNPNPNNDDIIGPPPGSRVPNNTPVDRLEIPLPQ